MSVFVKKYLAEKIAGNLSHLSSLFAKATIELNPQQIHAAYLVKEYLLYRIILRMLGLNLLKNSRGAR